MHATVLARRSYQTYLKCLWDAVTCKISPSLLTENVQHGISSMKQLKTRTSQLTVQVPHARYLPMHLVIQSIVFSYNWKKSNTTFSSPVMLGQQQKALKGLFWLC